MSHRFPLCRVLALACTLAGCSSGVVSHSSASQGTPAQLDQSNLTLAPLQFVSFCVRNGSECAPRGPSDALLPWTPELSATLVAVNLSVNARIAPSREENLWRINPTSGNCNDYVVSKRHELLARGLPSSALLISVVRTRAGEGHLVLVVRTDRGEMVLDNLTSQIRDAAETSYSWIKRQTTRDPKLWEKA
ncbi:transglutaminase-like cysteine peptidase [Bosea sp. (in: a-proteobacteria)]|uniref:transglutaminase-like cysteine peptidase n=1 Tax=Bosea sp. (in: a-proteobacteria) TaxID=1871050 RepID=UPI0025BF8B49|nr:transglutaminase-like cysteine peptidase [Bosea sp. (in: a-proteobacteria)]